MDAVTPPDNTVTTACGKTTAKRWGVASVVHHARNLALTTTLRASKDVWNAAAYEQDPSSPNLYSGEPV